jgi:hypothetical protein
MNAEFYNHQRVKEIIEGYCYKHRITEAKFAELIDVHPAHLPRIKKGEMASLDALGKIAALGKIQLKELILDTPDRLKQELFTVGRQKNIVVFV